MCYNKTKQRGVPALLLLKILLAAVPFLLGAAWASFADTAAWRLARGQSALRGRSHCPACGAALAPWELLPVFGWLALRGRCRHCGAAIGARSLLAETLGGLLALACRWRFGAAVAPRAGLFGLSWAALLALALCGLLYSVAAVDAETQTIPDRLNLAVAVCGLLALAADPGSAPARLAGALCISVPMFLLCLVIPGAFGGGDIKLMAAAGLALGWQCTLVAAFLALLGGGAWAAHLLLAHKVQRGDRFAFGPFLCAGIALSLFFGGDLFAWYAGLL